jgi:hypothetical protein
MRGSLTWLFSRAVAAAVLATAPGGGGDGLAVVAWVMGFSSALTYVDLRRRKELMLFRNLGLNPVAVVAVALSLATCAEVAWLLA